MLRALCVSVFLVGILVGCSPQRMEPNAIAIGFRPAVDLSATDPSLCGDWPLATQAIAARYGELRNCVRIAAPGLVEWLITTLGRRASHGVVATYRCRDAACEDGRTDHPLPGWRFSTAPHRGGVTLFGFMSPAVLIVGNGGYQLTFDAASLRFGQSGRSSA